jgi:putative endonuclease
MQNLPPGIAAAQPTLRVSGTCPFPRIGTSFAASRGMRGIGKRFVYILRSDVEPERHYVGVTSDVDNRLEWHNRGPCGHTGEHRPWSLVVVIEFPAEQQALRFERYLKSGSGRAFAKRHFGPHQEPAK